MKPPPRSETGSRIGPNAVIQLIAALKAAGLDEAGRAIFAEAGVADWLEAPPHEMAEELPVGRLHRTVRAALPPAQAEAVLRDAGRRTADYLLAVRIPRFAQIILRLLPASLAARALVASIRANAWTFAGSGTFSGRAGRPTVFELRHNPLCAGEQAQSPVCVWHAAVFQRLFQALVARDAVVVETACEASGADCCRFVVEWGARFPARQGHEQAQEALH